MCEPGVMGFMHEDLCNRNQRIIVRGFRSCHLTNVMNYVQLIRVVRFESHELMATSDCGHTLRFHAPVTSERKDENLKRTRVEKEVIAIQSDS